MFRKVIVVLFADAALVLGACGREAAGPVVELREIPSENSSGLYRRNIIHLQKGRLDVALVRMIPEFPKRDLGALVVSETSNDSDSRLVVLLSFKDTEDRRVVLRRGEGIRSSDVDAVHPLMSIHLLESTSPKSAAVWWLY